MSSNVSTQWTPERVDILKALWAEGLSCSQIAKQMGQGLTRNAVIGKAHRLDLAGRRPVTIPRSSLARKLKIRKRPSRPRVVEMEPVIKTEPLVLPPSTWEAIEGTQPVSMELVSGCRWPIGTTTPFKFCNEPISAGSFCRGHAAMGYRHVEQMGVSGKTHSRLVIRGEAAETLGRSDGACAFPSNPVASNEAVALPGDTPSSTQALGAPA